MTEKESQTAEELTTIKKEKGINKEHWQDYAKENKKLIHAVAHHFKQTPFSHEELFSAATVGFVQALRTFDPSYKVKFSTYAYNIMYREIIRFINKENRTVSMLMNVDYAERVEEDRHTSETLEEFHYGSRPTYDKPLQYLEEQSFIEQMNSYVQTLGEEEQFILNHRYGLNGCEIMTQSEIAEHLGTFQSSVSKAEKFALQKLRIIIESKDIEERKALGNF